MFRDYHLLTMAQAENCSWDLSINIQMVSYINYLKLFTSEPIIDHVLTYILYNIYIQFKENVSEPSE